MDRVEFEMDDAVTLRHFLRVGLLGAWWSVLARLLMVATGCFYLGMAIGITEMPRYWYVFVMLGCFVLGIWFLYWVLALQRGFWAFLRHQRRRGNVVRYVDDKGFGFESESHNGFFGWETFTCLRETRKEFVLVGEDRVTLILPKKALPRETVSKIREELRAAPVKLNLLRWEKGARVSATS